MGDSPGRHNRPSRRGSLARDRGPSSRVSSARSSAIFDDHVFLHPAAASSSSSGSLHPHQHQLQHQHQLRPADSRFSLHEQFAATRREYEFGDDDGASIFDRATVASDVPEEEEKTLTLDLDLSASAGEVKDDGEGEDEWLEERDYYEFMGLPADGWGVSEAQLRRAYCRMFALLRPEQCPENLKAASRKNFVHLQKAFETLVDPSKRAQYDAGTQALSDTEVDIYRRVADWNSVPRLSTSSDVWFRAVGLRRHQRPWRWYHDSKVAPLDFALSQSMSFNVPAHRWSLVQRATAAASTALSGLAWRGYTAKNQEIGGSAVLVSQSDLDQPAKDDGREKMLMFGQPIVTVTGGIYCIPETFITRYSSVRDALYHSYHPLLPRSFPRHGLSHIDDGRRALQPHLCVKLRQEIVQRRRQESQNGSAAFIFHVLEFETDPLLQRFSSGRIITQLPQPRLSQPVLLEASLEARKPAPHPELALAVSQRLSLGTVFARARSGDWWFWGRNPCRFLEAFEDMSPRGWRYHLFRDSIPRAELGFKTAPRDLSLAAAATNFRAGACDDGGMQGLDAELETAGDGSWTVCGAASPAALNAFARYSRDVSPSARVEAELNSSTRIDHHVAVRLLFRVGRYSRLGLEYTTTCRSSHLSLYWSRMNHRLSLPILFDITRQSRYAFWLGTLPFALAGLAPLLAHHHGLLKLFRASPRRPRRRGHKLEELDAESLAAHVSCRRSSADEVTALMAPAVEARQKREAQRGGLVVLSAKYGVREQGRKGVIASAREEVADVSVALAALLDDGDDGPRVVIPRGVRWGNIPGFWDPAPLEASKILVVRYAFRGKESMVVFSAGEEVVLPRLDTGSRAG